MVEADRTKKLEFIMINWANFLHNAIQLFFIGAKNIYIFVFQNFKEIGPQKIFDFLIFFGYLVAWDIIHINIKAIFI